MNDALNSPLLNTKDIKNAQRLLYIIYSCKDNPVNTKELGEINDFMDTLPEDLEVLWGLYHDDTIGNQVKVAVVATGFDKAREQKDGADEKNENIKRLWELYYPKAKPASLVEESQSDAESASEEEHDEDASESDSVEKGSNTGSKKKSWFNNFVEFIKVTLEEDK